MPKYFWRIWWELFSFGLVSQIRVLVHFGVCKRVTFFINERDGIRKLWLKFAIAIKKIFQNYFRTWAMLNWGGEYDTNRYFDNFSIWYHLFPRDVMKKIHDNREAILNEPISPKAFGNNGLHLRQQNIQILIMIWPLKLSQDGNLLYLPFKSQLLFQIRISK